MIRAVSFRLPAITSLLAVSSGATYWTPSRPAIADASSIVSVVAEPNEPRVTEPRVKPGLTVRRFVPRDWRRSLMPLVAPWPTLTSATTEATPMITPSIVRAVRILPVLSLPRARRSRSPNLMPAPLP